MKESGITRKVDEFGRISIPKSVRDDLGITEGTPLEFFIDGDQIIVKRYFPIKDVIINHINKCDELTKEEAVKIIEKAYDGELRR